MINQLQSKSIKLINVNIQLLEIDKSTYILYHQTVLGNLNISSGHFDLTFWCNRMIRYFIFSVGFFYNSTSWYDRTVTDCLMWKILERSKKCRMSQIIIMHVDIIVINGLASIKCLCLLMRMDNRILLMTVEINCGIFRY